MRQDSLAAYRSQRKALTRRHRPLSVHVTRASSAPCSDAWHVLRQKAAAVRRTRSSARPKTRLQRPDTFRPVSALQGCKRRHRSGRRRPLRSAGAFAESDRVPACELAPHTPSTVPSRQPTRFNSACSCLRKSVLPSGGRRMFCFCDSAATYLVSLSRLSRRWRRLLQLRQSCSGQLRINALRDRAR